MRDEFKGNEKFDFQENNVGLKDVSKFAILVKVANIFIMVFFIWLCVTSFYYTK